MKLEKNKVVWSQHGLIPANYMDSSEDHLDSDEDDIVSSDETLENISNASFVSFDLPNVKHVSINTFDIMNTMSKYADIALELDMPSYIEDLFRQCYIDMDLSEYDEAFLLASGITHSIFKAVKHFYMLSKHLHIVKYDEYQQNTIFISNSDRLYKNNVNIVTLLYMIAFQIVDDNKTELNMQFVGDGNEF